jgi:glutathione synthase
VFGAPIPGILARHFLPVKLARGLVSSQTVRCLFVMDPPQSVDVHHDSTFAVMLEAQARGYEVNYCLIGDLAMEHDTPVAIAHSVRLKAVQGQHLDIESSRKIDLRDMDAIFMRKDPPFDMEYVFATYILEAAEPDALVVNKAAGLRGNNEKLYILSFPELCPETTVASRADLLIAFQERLGGPMVIKPLDGKGGEGIFVVRADDPNRNVIIEISTRYGARPVMAQRYLPEARLGDKRILIIDGKFEGALLRVPSGSDHRGNMVAGATTEQGILTPREEQIVSALGPRLVEDGHLFVGIDVIGELITEINVTSPTGIHEINQLDGRRVEAAIIDCIERRASK